MISIYSFKHLDKVIYVGSTSQTVWRRFQKHKSDSQTCPEKLPVYAHINQVGWDNIIVETVCTCDDDARLNTERQVMEQHKDTVLNKYRPVISKEELLEYHRTWDRTNRIRPVVPRAKAAEYEKRYFEKNPERITIKKQQRAEWGKQKVWCPACGEHISRGSYKRHCDSTPHVVNLIQY